VRKLPLTDLIISKTIDILAVTETWLRPHDTASCIADISPPGYVFHHKPRPVGRGGGVGFLVSKQFKVNLQPSPNYTTFESMCLNISNSCFSGHFICIYRPPGHPANFFEQFQDLLENVVTIHSDFYIVGDFNLHLDTPSATTTTFNDILASFDTTQHVNFPTHIHGHWLDIIITRSSCKNIQTPTVVDGLSDHNTVIANLKVRTAPAVSKHNVFYRAFHSINIAAFMADITTSNLVTHPREHLSELYKQYHQILKTLLDKHAPI
jgi:exonuclease III